MASRSHPSHTMQGKVPEQKNNRRTAKGNGQHQQETNLCTQEAICDWRVQSMKSANQKRFKKAETKSSAYLTRARRERPRRKRCKEEKIADSNEHVDVQELGYSRPRMEPGKPSSPSATATPGSTCRICTAVIMSAFLETATGSAEITHGEEKRLVVFRGLGRERPTRAWPLTTAATDFQRRISAVASAGVPVAVIALCKVWWQVGISG